MATNEIRYRSKVFNLQPLAIVKVKIFKLCPYTYVRVVSVCHSSSSHEITFCTQCDSQNYPLIHVLSSIGNPHVCYKHFM